MIEALVSEEINSRYEMFHLSTLPRTLIARVKYALTYEGQNIQGDEKHRIVFDEEQIQSAEEMN